MDRATADNSSPPRSALRIVIGGQVQGVGYRPFVYRLASRVGVSGRVQNLSGVVAIEAEGTRAQLEDFVAALLGKAPPLARPELISTDVIPVAGRARFDIVASAPGAPADIHVPPDFFCCADCLRELRDPHDRRYRYPFINCTQCGPRYTLITRLPYDRANTAMAGFTLCAACRAEYENPADRRFHAQPVACPQCGPRLWFTARDQTRVEGNDAALRECSAALRAGAIVAVKGIGGYHLLCDAASDDAVARLRSRKNRPHKPLAVMFPWSGEDGSAAAGGALVLAEEARAALVSPSRPIVLATRREGAALSAQTAPGLNEVGAMLPYSPLHHLLLEAFGGPLIATSANISGEPVLTSSDDVMRRLGHVADAYLHHDREILRPVDDSVVRVIAGRARPLRLGRGMAPIERTLPFEISRPMLAVGGHMKNTVALAWGRRVVLSPHIGDLDSPRSVEVFEQVVADLQALYGVRAEHVVCDAHPDYASSRWAARSGLSTTRVFHHHAHASALAGEYPETRRWLIFAWDGVGLGEDGTLWGGEALLGEAGRWKRVASLRPFHLPGGERAGREPWRAAAGIAWELELPWTKGDDAGLVHQAWQRRLNTPQTSAAGRLFDAAAAMLGLAEKASFEGQGPMYLEALAAGNGEVIPLPLAKDEEGVWRSDWGPLMRYVWTSMANLARQSLSPSPSPAGRGVRGSAGEGGAPPPSLAQLAADFHASLAQALLDQARAVTQEHAFDAVGFTGGAFQNKRLCELALPLFAAAGYAVYLSEAIPCNDGGLAFGQVIHFGSMNA